MSPTDEMACASDWLAAKGSPFNDQKLWEKTTTDAARAVGADGVIGELVVGMKADISVFGWSQTPYRAIIDSNVDDVRLVIIDGQALYGVTDMVSLLAAEPTYCEALDVCGESRSICVQAGTSGDDAETLTDIESTLEGALSGSTMPAGYEYAGELFPIFTCTDERDSCDLSAPTSGDTDGDGIADGDDLCPNAYDPLQWDTDNDGIGDTCDDCPLTSESTCESAAGDLDADGIPNEDDNCPSIGNNDQADRDSDGIGDVCDDCPDEPNGAGGGCSTTVDAVRDPSNPDHPADGDVVVLSGLVVTGVRAAGGFFAQDPGLTEWGGLYVYDHGDNVVSVGDEVTVEGTYTEYYDATEITSPTVTVTGTGTVTPIVVDACDIATGAATAEPYEGMLMEVDGVSVTNINPDDPSDYDEFEVGGCLRVDDFLYDALDQPALDTSYTSLTGVLNYSFDNFKIVPRDAGDLQE
jgi:hypothetical protein